ncbi:MAG: TetR/AcrR family transcriptional regulator [Sphingomonadales bacterium]|nr:MAG: TetR/AcrR family transcriptional regulator [Sphingomonadales bacterium]TNF02717.1 MAG: TetR/AcrR family transcriptional regulator [Sphingomonadales bacterium]
MQFPEPSSFMSQAKTADSVNDTGKARSGYASPLIKARRHRILTETRKIISEQGIAGIAMEDVANRAGVAKRTIYNAFQSKERLIAAAIQQYFNEYATRLTFETEEATVDRIIERLAIVARRNLKIRNYTRALMNIYYTHEVDPEIQRAIYDIAAASHEPWIRQLQKKRQLQPWVNADELIRSVVAYRYSIAFAWAEGQMSNEEFILALIRGVLTFMSGSTRGQARKEIDERLATLEENPFITGEKGGTA